MFSNKKKYKEAIRDYKKALEIIQKNTKNINHETVKKEITKCFEDKNYFLDLNNKIKILIKYV